MKKWKKNPAFLPVVISLLFFVGLIFTGWMIWEHFVTVPAASVSSQNSAGKTKTVREIKQQAAGNSHSLQKKSGETAAAKAIDRLLAQSGFSGTAVIVSHGQVILNKGYLFSDWRSKNPNSVLTRYYIGSMTKAVTAAAFMQLDQQRLVHFDSRVSQYYPAFPNGSKITLLDLLDHVSGLGSDNESLQNLTRDQLVAKIARLNPKLHSRPGTEWSYQDTNYALLGAILDKICENRLHESLHDFITQSIFQNAGMDNSGFGGAGEHSANSSISYLKQGRILIQSYIPSLSQLLGCGDIYSTAWDLYLFDHALATDQLMSDSSRVQIFTNRFPGCSYSLGWYLGRHGWGSNTYSSHGVLGGWEGSNAFSRDRQNYVILLSNVRNPRIWFGELNEKIFSILQK